MAQQALGEGAAERKPKCQLCNLPVEDDDYVQASTHTVRCKTCNVSRVTAHRAMGSWPPEQFSVLSPKEQALFWQALKTGGAKDKRGQMQTHVMTQLCKVVTESEIYSLGGSYQPLGYYRTLGYDCEKIQATCKDKKEHVNLGTVYKVLIESSSREERSARVMKQLQEHARNAKLQSAQKTQAKAALKATDDAFKFGEEPAEGPASDSDDDSESDEESSSEPPPRKTKGKNKKQAGKKNKNKAKDKSKDKSKGASKKEIKQALAVLKGLGK